MSMSDLQAERLNPSSTTVLGLFSAMMGGATLTMPILFRSTGLITGSIILALSGLISFITCRIYVMHMSAEDKNAESMIRRLLGSKWERRFRFITGFYLIMLCVIYIELIVDQLYSIIFFFCDRMGSPDAIASKEDFVFTKFSQQWLSIMLFLPLLALVFIKKLHILLKLSEYGSYSTMLYFLYVIYKFVDALINDQIHIENITWVSMDIGNLAGNCALAFTIQSIVVTFVKENKDQSKNERDVGLAYLMGFSVYQLIGVFGVFAVSGLDCKQTLLNCYLHEWTILIVEVSYLFGRVTIFPCNLEVARYRLLQLFIDRVEDYHLRNFNIGFMVFATIMCVLGPFIPITLMMNIVGAVVCFFSIYLFPTLLHFACLYKKKNADEESLIKSVTTLEDTPRRVACSHATHYAQKKSKMWRYLIYGSINAVGVAIGIYGLYTSYQQITA